MPRPVKRRRVCEPPRNARFGPLDGAPAESVVLAVDEYETIRLIDLLGLTQGGSAFCARYQTISEDANMKIAVTYENGLVFQHFGHTQQFKLYTVENGKITSSEVVDTNGSGHGALAVFLKTHGVDTLICGGIGGGARTALAEAGIALYPGARGAADAQAEALLAGTLAYDPDTTCAHHEHHGEGHEGCHGHHGEGHTCGGHCGH